LRGRNLPFLLLRPSMHRSSTIHFTFQYSFFVSRCSKKQSIGWKERERSRSRFRAAYH
jgi:hypothetical protein